MNTLSTSGAHGSVQSKDSGEELSIPAMKRRRVHEENSVSLMSGLGRETVHGEPVTLPRQLPLQHQHPQHHNHLSHRCHSPQHQSQHHHAFMPPTLLPLSSSTVAPSSSHQSPVHSRTYQPPHYPSFGPPLTGTSYLPIP